MLGPLVAFMVLAAMPRRFDILFAISFAMALVGLGVILLCVRPTTGRATPRPGSGHAKTLTPVSNERMRDVLRAPRFRAIVVAGFVLGLPTMSDGFIFLSLQNRLQMGVTAFPLFYVATSLFTAMFSVPSGLCRSDRPDEGAAARLRAARRDLTRRCCRRPSLPRSR